MLPGHRGDVALLVFVVAAAVLLGPDATQARVCGNVIIRNDLSDIEKKLSNCTTIAGFLQMVLLEKVTDADISKYSFPELTEVYDYVFFFRVYGLARLGQLFPNLKVIRGYEVWNGYTLVLHSVPQLKEIGWKHLKLIGRGNVWIRDCGDLCFANTIDWGQLGTKLVYTDKPGQKECPKCDPKCDGHCWYENECQNMTKLQSCPHYENDGECVDKCPQNSSVLLPGNYCIPNKDCYNLDPSWYNDRWFIFNGTCTRLCPSQHIMVGDGACQFCGENCFIYCKGEEITSLQSLYTFKDCKHVNGSLILRVDNSEVARKLGNYLGNIEEIQDVLKIHRSPAIKSLEFFKKLKRIRGENLMNNKSFMVLDNFNLWKLWDWDGFELDIVRGGISFHYNHKLCLNEIKIFASRTNQSFTDLDVSPRSNGDQGVCEPFEHKILLTNKTSTNVTLEWEVINSTYEGYFVYYKETDRKGSSESCDDDWSVVVGEAKTPVMITNLMPFVNYTYYLMMNSNSSHPYSRTKKHYFKTLAGDPPAPDNVRAVSEVWDSMVITWDHPREPRGELDYYVITMYVEEDDRRFMDLRNYCKSRDLIKHNTRKVETIFREATVTEDQCACPGNSEFAVKYVCSMVSQDPNWRRNNDCDSFEAYTTFNEEFPKMHGRQKRDEIMGRDLKERYVNATEKRYVMTNLDPFRIYVFLISVCNKNVTEQKLCSEVVMVYNRTNVKESADDLVDLTIELKGDNLEVRWSEPANPNAVIVAYDVEHRIEGVLGLGTDCVTRLEHEAAGNVYTIRNLQPGRHDVKVRAVSLAGPGRYSKSLYKKVRDPSGEALLIVSLTICAVVTSSCVGFYFYYRWRKKHEFEQMHLITSVNPDYAGPIYVPDEWEIERSNIDIQRELGQGSFGMVFSGTIKSLKLPCAVKTINDNANFGDRMEFLNEASVMKSFSAAHHVVRLLGVVSSGKPPLVVMELMECGDLKTFLRKSRDSSTAITNNEMYRMSAEIADGMAYLSAKKFVHRDLAARNCMVSADHTLKIGDFGMARDIYENDYYRKETHGFLPVRWMAPESLADGVFTSDSDVWSYGVVLWEMSTLAEQPYQGLANEQVFQFVKSRGTLQRPPDCCDLLYEIMHFCWRWRPNTRPQFTDIVQKLENHVGLDFRLVSFYHSREGEEYRLNRRERPSNPPVVADAHFVTSEDEVSLCSLENLGPNNFLYPHQRNTKTQK